ncbi:MAG TPA: DUF481 domain-containing protein [Cellvibrio sp.]|nr:DUF481 domain-containing protein [Cellvibrio sp.]
MYKILFCVLLLWPALPVLAISNIESERISLPEEGLSGGIKLGMDGKTGNQKQQSYEGSLKGVYRESKEIFMALLAKEYGSTRDVKDTDTRFVHGRWTHLFNDRWALEAFAQWEENEFDNLTSRVLAGGGGRRTLALEANVYQFAVGVGAFREYEKLDLLTYKEENRLWRINSYYSYQHQINEQLLLSNVTYYQPATESGNDYRVLSDIGFLVKLSNSLKFSVNYRLTYDSSPAKNLQANPPIDNHQTNTEYKTALIYSF